MGKTRGHIPIRTCIACRAKRPKASLVRLTLDPGGCGLRAGAQPGRGAYVCPDLDCWKSVFERGRLSRAFKRNLKFSAPVEPPWLDSAKPSSQHGCKDIGAYTRD